MISGLVLERERHVVAQVVETQLVVRGVGDVAGIGLTLLLTGLPGADHADRQPEEAEDASHPVRIAPCEIVVDGDDVHALAGQRIEIGGERRDQRLAFAGAHLGDLAVMQHRTADQLDVEVAHVEHAPARLAHHGEGIRLDLIERLTLAQALAQHARLVGEFGIAHRGIARFEGPDRGNETVETLENALIPAPEDASQQIVDHSFGFEPRPAAWNDRRPLLCPRLGGGVRTIQGRRTGVRFSAPRGCTAPGSP